LRQRLPVYPEFMEQAGQKSELLAQKLAQTADSERYARSAA
jgi:hypothetical protein